LDNPDYRRIEQAINYLQEHVAEQPSLDEVAKHIGLSAYHFQRLFKSWAGVSPKRFLQYLTVGNAKRLLRKSTSVLDAALDVGLSGPGRLHDLFVSAEAMTPGEYKNQGKGLQISYGFHSTPFGECLLAVTSRGICSLEFVEPENRSDTLKGLLESWQEESIVVKVPSSRFLAKVTTRRRHRLKFYFGEQTSRLKCGKRFCAFLKAWLPHTDLWPMPLVTPELIEQLAPLLAITRLPT
jgi:AraC-like DNA-binding protein